MRLLTITSKLIYHELINAREIIRRKRPQIRIPFPLYSFNLTRDLNPTGQRLCEIIEGPAALQERGPSQRPPLHHEALERGEHAEKHQESACRMITEATRRLLYQKLRLPAALPCRHFSSGAVSDDDNYARQLGPRISRSRIKCDPPSVRLPFCTRQRMMDHGVSSETLSENCRAA